MPFPENVLRLTDGTVTLRAHAPGDAPRIVAQSRDPESLRWTTVPGDYTLAMAHDFLAEIARGWDAEPGVRHWALCAADDPGEAYLGTIDVRPRGGGLAAVGYGLHPDGRGRHLMSGALRLAARWWFEEAGGQRLTWTAYGGNFASWAVARAAGFRFEAVAPGIDALRTGEVVDEWHGARDAADPGAPAAPWYDSPELAGGPVRLRAWRDADLEAIEAPEHPPHWLPGRAVPTPETFGAWLARRRLGMARGIVQGWCIADAETDRALGDVVLFAREGAIAAGDTAELGYWLAPSARGRGVARTAAGLAAAYAFRPESEGGLGLRRLVAITAADNAGSNGVLTAAGFTRWGAEPDDTAPDGSVGTAYHWARLRG